MAHAANLNQLAESLVTAVTGRSTNDPAFRKLKENAVKGLQDKRHARTNQFAVQERLDGLVEKFTVLNRDPLADALQKRITKLGSHSGWTPEVLSLLMELSDQPATKAKSTHLEESDLEEAKIQSLTWQDIIAEDPLDDEPDIWETVERGYHSSGDESLLNDEESERTVSTVATSLDHQSPSELARLHLVQPNDNDLDNVAAARAIWTKDRATTAVVELSELAVTREILFMLRGLATNLFEKDESTGQVTINRQIRLTTASRNSLHSILSSIADTGFALNFLRVWVKKSASLAHIQSIQAAVQSLLAGFGQRLDVLERRLIYPTEDQVVSAIEVLAETHGAARPLVQLSMLIDRTASKTASPFSLLDALYEAASIAQMAGDRSYFTTTAKLFCSALQTYLRPIESWVLIGSIAPQHENVFFVQESKKDCPPGDMWHSRFGQRDTVYIPTCMRPFAARIFALGKSKAFLQDLESNRSELESTDVSPRQLTIFEGQHLENDSLVPFPDRLNNWAESWLAELTSDNMPLLSRRLLHDHGLADTLAALPFVYFSKNGFQFQAFAETLIERVGRKDAHGAWSDQFLLTELAHETLGSSPGVNAESIHVGLPRTNKESAAASTIRKLGAVTLRYALPWPVQNITRSKTPKSHARVFSFLLQISSAAAALTADIFRHRSETPNSHHALKLRQRLHGFVSILHSHVVHTADSIHEKMRAQMEAAGDIDRMVTVWVEYEKQLQTSLLLATNLEPLRDAIVGIMELGNIISKTTRPDAFKSLQKQFDKSLSFLIAGLKSVSRANGDASLEILAERLG